MTSKIVYTRIQELFKSILWFIPYYIPVHTLSLVTNSL